MKKLLLTTTLAVTMLAGCSSIVPNTSTYSSMITNYTSYQGSVNMGEFSYEPYKLGKLKATEIENTAAGTPHLGTTVADFAKNATYTELKKMGLSTSNSGVTLKANVKQFKVDDLGLNINFHYTINYTLIDDSTHKTLLDKDYTADSLTINKLADDFSTYLTLFHKTAGNAAIKFISDPSVRQILEKR